MDTEQRIHASIDEVNRRKDSSEKYIWVRFQREGIHAYPMAAIDPDLDDVKFLAHPHRHIFHFEVRIAISHLGREIEFIKFKRYCEGLFSKGILELDSKSCEMICDDLFDQIGYTYPGRDVYISVSEDNENGASIDYKI